MSLVEESRSPSRVPVVVLAVLLAAAVVALTLVTLAWRHERDLRDAGSAAEKAARTAVVEMTTYDYKSLDHDFAWVDDAGTTKFREHFAKATAPLKTLVTAEKASAQGSVVASAAHVQDTSHVTVLLFVDQTLTKPGQTQRSLDQPRVEMTMVEQGGRWLVDDVSLVSLTGG